MALFPVGFNARNYEPFVYKCCSVIGCGLDRYTKTSEFCKKHHLFNWRHGEAPKRSRFDPNEIEICQEYALMYLYDKKGAIMTKTLIDLDDVSKLSKTRWSFLNGYVVNGKLGKIHNVIMGVRAMHDHKNNNPLDNRKENLRLCTTQENAFNNTKPSNNTSGAKGVSWNKRKQMCEAYISCGKRKFLGYYDDMINAAEAYNKAASELFGEFAKVNDIKLLNSSSTTK